MEENMTDVYFFVNMLEMKIIRCRIFCLPACYPKTKIRLYRTIILLFVLYGCETWSLTLREERKLRVFETRLLTRIFGPKRDEATEEWRRLHNEELNDLYSSPYIFRVTKSRGMRWARHVAHMGEKRGAYRILVGRPYGKRPLGKPRHKWIFKKWDGHKHWIELAQDREGGGLL
jgi:hypothetical protein